MLSGKNFRLTVIAILEEGENANMCIHERSIHHQRFFSFLWNRRLKFVLLLTLLSHFHLIDFDAQTAFGNAHLCGERIDESRNNSLLLI